MVQGPASARTVAMWRAQRAVGTIWPQQTCEVNSVNVGSTFDGVTAVTAFAYGGEITQPHSLPHVEELPASVIRLLNRIAPESVTISSSSGTETPRILRRSRYFIHGQTTTAPSRTAKRNVYVLVSNIVQRIDGWVRSAPICSNSTSGSEVPDGGDEPRPNH